jgi:hypothetical protein
VVDQIQEWLKLIPPEERQRWSWLLDQNTTAFGNPRMVDTPVGRVWNPSSYPSDLLSGLNTAVREPFMENVQQPALGLATYAASLLPSTPRVDWHIGPDGVGVQVVPSQVPGGRRKFFSEEAEAPLQGADFGRYWRENKPTEGIPGFMASTIEDPASLLGGPIAEGARGLAALPLLRSVPGVARGLGAVAGADELYSETMGKAVGSALGGAGWVGRRIPGVGPWLEDSPQKAIALFSGNLRRAVDDPQAADRLEALVDPSTLGLKGQAVDWEKTIRPAWETIDTAINEASHPLQQATLIQQRAKALELENVLEARFEQHRMALEEGRLAGEISNAEFGRETRSLWQLQARAVRALQLGLIDSVNAVTGHGDELVAGLPGTVDAAGAAIPGTLQDVFGAVGDDAVQSSTLSTALRRASDEALAAHDIGTALTGGTSGVDNVTGLFSMGMGEEGQRIAGLQAQDPFYRQARAAAIKELNDAADAVFARYADVATPEDVDALTDTARSAFQAAENELAPFTQTPEQALGGLAPSKRDAIMQVWDTDSGVSLPKQLKRVLAARRALVDQVSPALHDWYRTMGASLEQRTAAVEAAVSNADRLLAEPALRAPEAAALRKAVEDRLNKFNGDLLMAGEAPKLAANLTVSAYAKSLGVKAPHPLLGAAATQLSAWKEQAILSPAFQLSNLIGGLVLGEAGGVSGIRVLNLLRKTLPQFKGVIFEGKPLDLVFDAANSRLYSGIYGRAADGAITATEELVGRSSGEVLNIGGRATGPAATASGRIPLVLRAGLPALTTGGGYWAGNPDDPDRARNALLVGGAAASFGAATPRFAFYNQNVSAASETAMRLGAHLTGVEEEMGDLVTGRIANFHDHLIEATLAKPTTVTSVGKELTRSDMFPGMNTVSGMQTLSDFLPAQKGVLPPLEAPPVPPRPSVPGGLPPMTPDEFATVGYQRIEEPGRGRPDVSRPQGIFTTPASATSPHADLGGEQFYWRRAPDLNVLSVSAAEDEAYRALRGSTWAGSGVVALKDMLGPQEFARVTRMSRQELLERIEQEFPGAMDPARGASRDRQDIIEAWAGLEARKRGYDAIEMIDPTDPAETEFVALTERALVPAGPPTIEVAPPDAMASRVLGLHRAGPSPTATVGGQTDIAAVKAAFREAKGHVSPDVVEEIALRHGATAEEAARLRSVWDQEATLGYQAGLKRANDIHFDYSDVNRLVAGARDTGILPFITWQTKALPKFATLLLQNPRFLIAIDGLNNLTDEDADEAGLTSRYARLVKLGVLGDVLAQQVLGRADGTVLGAPLKALFPYGDVGREGTVPENANPLEKTLAALRPLGVSPGPIVSLPLMATGAISELPMDINPTSRYLRPLSTQLTGREADPELLTRRLMAAARTATGAPVEPTVTGDFLRDRAIRQRIAELSVEERGEPPRGDYLLAMDDPASQIWLRARAQVDRQRMGENLLGATLPFRTKYLSDTEAEVRRVREQTGVGPEATAARRTLPVTPDELAAAAAEVKRKPLKPGETLETRIGRNRWIAAENTAAGINPLAKTLNSLGGDDALSRQFPEYLALQRRIKHMPPKRRGQVLAEFLGPRPALQKYLSEHNIYG